MDIKNKRRDAVKPGQTWDSMLPDVEGMYPADNGSSADYKRKGHGNAASDNNVGWDVRAQSWQRGADTDFTAVDAENREAHQKFGVPYEDNFPAPSDPAGPENCGARYQTASYNADDTLPNPHNFSSNPGFMGASGPSDFGNNAPAGGSMRSSSPGRSLQKSGGPRRAQTGGGSTGLSPIGGRNRSVAMPAASTNDSKGDNAPQVISSGYSG